LTKALLLIAGPYFFNLIAANGVLYNGKNIIYILVPDRLDGITAFIERGAAIVGSHQFPDSLRS
jgi:hypothetical protein